MLQSSFFVAGDITVLETATDRLAELRVTSKIVESTLGVCEIQLKSHLRGYLSVGNNRETMIEAITQSLPYMGFPRSLNALNCVNEVAPESNK